MEKLARRQTLFTGQREKAREREREREGERERGREREKERERDRLNFYACKQGILKGISLYR
jgi:hypothetical protein